MKLLVLVLVATLSGALCQAQGFLEGNPDGTVWLCETPVNDFTIGSIEQFGLWRQKESLLSPSQHVSAWTFSSHELVIEYHGPDTTKNARVECTYLYDQSTKMLSIMHFTQRSQRWDYKLGIVSTGAFVYLTRE